MPHLLDEESERRAAGRKQGDRRHDVDDARASARWRDINAFDRGLGTGYRVPDAAASG
jgi:hypothetical protein